MGREVEHVTAEHANGEHVLAVRVLGDDAAVTSRHTELNHEGLIKGYSRSDRENYIENFSNHWADRYAGTDLQLMKLCIDTFEHEYSNVWTEHFLLLESWPEENDGFLGKAESERQCSARAMQRLLDARGIATRCSQNRYVGWLTLEVHVSRSLVGLAPGLAW